MRGIPVLGGPLDGESVVCGNQFFERAGLVYRRGHSRGRTVYLFAGHSAWRCPNCRGYLTPPEGASVDACPLCGAAREPSPDDSGRPSRPW